MKTTLSNNYSAAVGKEELYLRMIEEVDDYAILLLDTEGNIQSWNKGAEKIIKFQPEEVIGHHVRMLYTNADKVQHLPEQLLQKASDTGKVVNEGWRVRKGGSVFWAHTLLTALHDDNNAVIGYSKLTRDITEKKKADERFRVVVESAPNALVLVNREGKIELVNRQLEKLFQYDRKELIGQSLSVLMPQRYHEQHSDYKKTFFATPELRAMGKGRDLFAVRKDGSEIQVEIGLNPLESTNGTMVLASIIDITERKLTEDRLKQQVRQLEFQNKELEQFVYIASHDLQEPLRTVSSFAELLEHTHKKILDPTATLYLQYIMDASGRMRGLVKALLDYSRIGRQKCVMLVDTTTVLAEICSDLSATIGEKSAMITYSNLPVLKVHTTEFKLLLQNLISNGIKFARPGIQPAIKVDASQEKGFWKFSVQDNGIGIKERFFEKIFVIFQRLHTQKEYEGTGIGLAHCKKIVELHGGEIWVDSELGQGSTFYFTIPYKK